jgi:hypothetical protein
LRVLFETLSAPIRRDVSHLARLLFSVEFRSRTDCQALHARPPPPPCWHRARAVPRDLSRLTAPPVAWGLPPCHVSPLRPCTHAMHPADGLGMGWAGKFKFYYFLEASDGDDKRLFSTSQCFPPCVAVSPLLRRFPIFRARARMRSYNMFVRGSYCAPNANGEEAEGERFRGPMSQDSTTPTTGEDGRNTHRCSKECGTACKKVSANDRDSEGVSSEAKSYPDK